ncbi:hypothetical protein WK24_19180 [Burkholderia vietnamiensis]|nr:hypothetical protein WK24_19180 [Burkholderia vietnamiensis]
MQMNHVRPFDSQTTCQLKDSSEVMQRADGPPHANIDQSNRRVKQFANVLRGFVSLGIHHDDIVSRGDATVAKIHEKRQNAATERLRNVNDLAFHFAPRAKTESVSPRIADGRRQRRCAPP